MAYTNYLPLSTEVWYEHSSGGVATFTAGDRAVFTELLAKDNAGGDVALNGGSDGIVLAADTGVYEVTVFVDTEAPAAGDSTTIEVLVNAAAFSYFVVDEPGGQVGSWNALLDTAGAAQTVEVNRSAVTGTGRLDVKANIEALG